MAYGHYSDLGAVEGKGSKLGVKWKAPKSKEAVASEAGQYFIHVSGSIRFLEAFVDHHRTLRKSMDCRGSGYEFWCAPFVACALSGTVPNGDIPCP